MSRAACPERTLKLLLSHDDAATNATSGALLESKPGRRLSQARSALGNQRKGERPGVVRSVSASLQGVDRGRDSRDKVLQRLMEDELDVEMQELALELELHVLPGQAPYYLRVVQGGREVQEAACVCERFVEEEELEDTQQHLTDMMARCLAALHSANEQHQVQRLVPLGASLRVAHCVKCCD